MINATTKQPVIRFTGLRLATVGDISKVSIDWEYTPGNAVLSESLQLQSSTDDGKRYQNVPSAVLRPCEDICRQEVHLNMSIKLLEVNFCHGGSFPVESSDDSVLETLPVHKVAVVLWKNQLDFFFH